MKPAQCRAIQFSSCAQERPLNRLGGRQLKNIVKNLEPLATDTCQKQWSTDTGRRLLSQALVLFRAMEATVNRERLALLNM